MPHRPRFDRIAQFSNLLQTEFIYAAGSSRGNVQQASQTAGGGRESAAVRALDDTQFAPGIAVCSAANLWPLYFLAKARYNLPQKAALQKASGYRHAIAPGLCGLDHSRASAHRSNVLARFCRVSPQQQVYPRKSTRHWSSSPSVRTIIEHRPRDSNSLYPHASAWPESLPKKRRPAVSEHYAARTRSLQDRQGLASVRAARQKTPALNVAISKQRGPRLHSPACI